MNVTDQLQIKVNEAIYTELSHMIEVMKLMDAQIAILQERVKALEQASLDGETGVG